MRPLRHTCRLCKREINPSEQRCIAVGLTGDERHTHYSCEVAKRDQQKEVA